MNKDQKTTEYLNKMKDMKLSDSSRARMESNLLEYARFHGVKEGVRIGDDRRSIKQVPQRTSLFNLLRPKSMTAAIIAIALIAGGGTSYAAEGAVPGEFLYTVKTEINENVKSALAISDEAEAKLQARLAEERLKEAEELASRGELTAKVATDISARVRSHVENAEERNAQAEAEGDFESSATVRASLEGSFRAYANILSDLNTSVLGNDGSILVTDIQKYSEGTAKAQTNATATIEASMSTKSAAKATIAQADDLIAKVTVELEKAKSEISAEAYASAEVKLGGATEAQSEAKASFQAEAYSSAYASAQTAVRIASEVETMIKSMLRVGVDIRTDIDVDARQPGDPIPGIDITIEQDTGDNKRTETGSDTNTESDSRTGTTSQSGIDHSVDVEVDATTDTEVDTGVIDAGVKTNTSIQSNI